MIRYSSALVRGDVVERQRLEGVVGQGDPEDGIGLPFVDHSQGTVLLKLTDNGPGGVDFDQRLVGIIFHGGYVNGPDILGEHGSQAVSDTSVEPEQGTQQQ